MPTLVEIGLLTLVGLVAGTVDAIAGGGGLLTLPALLSVGLPPHAALATNKGQSVFGSASALYTYACRGQVDRRRAPTAFAFGFAGALGGAFLALSVSPQSLRPVIIILMVAAACFVSLPRSSRTSALAQSPRAAFVAGLGVATLLGLYDGFFGPGTGTLLIVLYVWLLGDSLVAASANAKVVNFGTNLAAVAVFVAAGKVVWAVALPMAAGQLVGGRIGASFTVRRGQGVVRIAVLVVAGALVVKLAVEMG